MASKVLVVTGASREIVKQLLARDQKVIAVARSEDKLKQLYGNNESVAIVVGDVTDSTLPGKIVETAVSKFGQLDAVIANAGVLDPVAPISKSSINDWKTLFDINVFSVVQLIADCLPELRKTKGRVVTVSLGASTSYYDGWGAYGASKAALNRIILQLAAEEPLIKSVSVAPGVVDTEMQQDIREKFSANMKPEASKKFFDLHETGNLLPALVPAAVYVKLALDEFDDLLNGQYIRYDDERVQ